MKAMLVYTTNEKFKYMQGATGILHYKKNVSGVFEMLRGFLTTSVIEYIEETENTIVLKTMNSVYVFEKLHTDNKSRDIAEYLYKAIAEDIMDRFVKNSIKDTLEYAQDEAVIKALKVTYNYYCKQDEKIEE